MKNIFKVHPLTYILLLLISITANFRLYICFMILIIIHEFGHIISGYFFHWKLKEIVILPFGMISKYNNLVNTSINEEIIVASMGVICQLVFYLLFFRYDKMFSICNLVIILFNLLPIYPLDGSKLLNGIMNKLFSFQFSYYFIIYLSIIFSIVMILISLIFRDLLLFIIFFPLLLGIKKEWINRKSVINKFYLERYLYQLSFSKIKYIEDKKITKMKKNFYHYFLVNKKIVKEEIILADLFDKQ